MTAVILTIHVLIVLALIVVVLLQRSDGGALGLGGGGGGFMTGRGAANALTRTTSLLAAVFFATSLILAITAGAGENTEDVIEELTGETAPAQDLEPTAPSTDDILNRLGGGASEDAETVPLNEQEILDALGADEALPLPESAAPETETVEDTPSDPAQEDAEGDEPPNN